MYSDDYYNNVYFFQMIESNPPVGHAFKEEELQLMRARVITEINEVDRRLNESEVYEKYYAAKFEP